MIPFDAALALLESAVVPLPAETVTLAEATGRILAEPVYAAISSPRRDVAAMDGYAVRGDEAAPGARFRVIGESCAGGARPPPLGPGEAVRIFTGAAMPDGADRVIIQENCIQSADIMTIVQPFGPARHVRRRGSDFSTGDLLLPAGQRLSPQTMVTLAAADHAMARVRRRPSVALVATGDELAPPGRAGARPHSIPESVSFGVAALAAEHGGAISARFTGADNLPGLERIADQALDAADLIVVTGGASVGARDFAKAMFVPHVLDLLFTKVAIRPGKPVWLGRARNRWVLGLPGNPSSAMVTARLFLAPLLGALQGRPPGDALEWLTLPLGAALSPAGERETFARATWRRGALHPVSNQDSGAQGVLAEANWLIRCPAGSAEYAAGQSVSALRF